MIIFAKNFNNFWEKIWFVLRENVTIFAKKLDDFFRKILRLQENLTVFQGIQTIFAGSLMVFKGITDDSSGKLVDFCSKIFWFIIPASPRVFYHNNSHTSKTRQILLKKSSNFLVKIAKFSWRMSNFFANTIKFSCNYLPSNFSIKIINFPHKNC